MPSINSRFGSQVGTYNAEIINIYNSDIGDRVKIGSFTEIGGAEIGADTVVSAFVFICPGVVIGERCFIGPRVTFTNHKYPKIDPDFVPEKTIVEDDVVIGAGVLVLPGIVIGKGAKIGAGAVLTGDVAPGATVLGFPARERSDVWADEVESLPVLNKPPEEKFDVNAVLDILRKQGYKTDGNNYKVVEDFSPEAVARGYGPAQTSVNEHEFKPESVGQERRSAAMGPLPKEEEVQRTKYAEQAFEPQYCGEMPEVPSNDVPEIDYEKFKEFMKADEDIFISRTKACKGKCMVEPKAEEEDFVGLKLGYRKE